MDNKFPGKDITTSDLQSKLPLVSWRQPKGVGTKVKVGEDVIFGDNAIPIIAGPNLVESEEMIFQVAKFLRDHGVRVIRGGCFKPLTFPYRSDSYFETGIEGLNWLAKASREFGLVSVTEAMTEEQVDLVCEHSNMIQIGTRNMQNYPLLVYAAKTNFPIILKRGFGCSLRDWLGAAEYILNEGNNNVVLCERGVVAAHTHRSTSRFLLDLQVIPAAKEVSHLPIITDPSHATFWAKWVPPLALASIAAGADGVMLEVHENPKEAAVDPLQPLNFNEFSQLLKGMSSVASAVNRKLG